MQTMKIEWTPYQPYDRAPRKGWTADVGKLTVRVHEEFRLGQGGRRIWAGYITVPGYDINIRLILPSSIDSGEEARARAAELLAYLVELCADLDAEKIKGESEVKFLDDGPWLTVEAESEEEILFLHEFREKEQPVMMDLPISSLSVAGGNSADQVDFLARIALAFRDYHEKQKARRWLLANCNRETLIHLKALCRLGLPFPTYIFHLPSEAGEYNHA